MSRTHTLTLRIEDFQPPKEVNEPNAFGEAGNFWVKYDEMASKSDDDMIERLNGNLDILLIFAGLFSSVNTAFIVVALNILSAGSADQTNHLLRLLLTNGTSNAFTSDDLAPPSFRPSTAAVRQNCLFFASLGCSLLAAAGTVLAKQWLQCYQRTGQTGPMRSQAMKRTEKFLGAEFWELSRVVETLPALLQVSLVLFFAALVDYLWQIDRLVAVVMLTLASVGYIAYGFTVIVSTMDEACPFQTPISRYLRTSYRPSRNLSNDTKGIFGHLCTWFNQGITCSCGILGNLKEVMSSSLHRTYVQTRDGDTRVVPDAPSATPLRSHESMASAITTAYNRPCKFLKQKPSQGREALAVEHDSFIYASAAIWMAQAAPERDNIMTIAENIPFITNLESVRLIAPSEAFSGLLYWFRSSLLALQRYNTATRIANTVILAKAIVHVVLADTRQTSEAVRKVFESVGSLEWLLGLCGQGIKGLEELMVLLNSISIIFDDGERKQMSEKLISIDDTLRKGLQRSTRTGAAASIDLHRIILSVPSSTNRLEDVKNHVDAIGKTLLLEHAKVDTAYVSCVALALTLTLRASPILRPLSKLRDPLEEKIKAWAARTQDSLSDNLLDALDAFSKYYVHARHSSPPRDIYAPLLQCQKQLLVHSKAINSLNDSMPQQTRPPQAAWFQKMHAVLNVNIREVLTMDTTVLHPHIEPFDLRICLDTLVDSLRDLLLTPSSQWSIVNTSDLENTARWARRLGSKEDRLSEAILYRYFVYTHPILYRPTPRNERLEKLARDRNVGSVLISCLRLYLWLYPAIAPKQRWATFGGYLHFLATGERQAEDPSHVIDWIPNAIAKDAWEGEERTPTIRTASDPRRYRPPPLAPSRNNTLAEAVEETVAGMWQEGELGTYSLMGPGMLWIAESLRYQEAWAAQFDEKRMVRLFIGILRQVREDDERVRAGAEMWSSVDVQGAGALFLRAWVAGTTSSSSNPSGASKVDSSGWMSESAIEAFAYWLRTFDGQRAIQIKDKLDDVVMLQTTVDFDVILRFIERAYIDNHDAANKFRLDKARDELIHGPMTPVARMMMNPWRERKSGLTPAPSASKSEKKMPAKKAVAYKDKHRPLPLRALPEGERPHSPFSPDGTYIQLSNSPETTEFKTAV
ncbi:hypothetical protein FRB97_008328 [Tulasnella sp. 331]|nr:hypothetical protein FRB97_008328 [Tulasnella sp. 331]